MSGLDAHLVGGHFYVAAKARSARRRDPSGFGPAGTGIQRKGFALLHFVPALRVHRPPMVPASGPP
nr:hypothetical protein SHINE37_90142 [Rhizobiaceae bacterium]